MRHTTIRPLRSYEESSMVFECNAIRVIRGRSAHCSDETAGEGGRNVETQIGRDDGESREGKGESRRRTKDGNGEEVIEMEARK